MTLKEQYIKAIDETLESIKNVNHDSFQDNAANETTKEAFCKALSESELGLQFISAMTVQAMLDGDITKSIIAAMTAAIFIEQTASVKVMAAKAN